jgi:hypothetical protein
MPRARIDEIAALLEESLSVWHLNGRVEFVGEVLVVSARGQTVRISVAAEGVPFPWMVVTAEKTRGVGSIAALLRAVRNVLDPEHAGNRLRLAPQGVLSS